MSFADAIAAAAKAAPQDKAVGPMVPGRILLIDGDGLAYYCAGGDDKSPAEARLWLWEKVTSAQRAARAEEVRLLLTSDTSPKGYRYAIATVKPYQGQRKSHKPKNWQFLRDYMLTADHPWLVEVTDQQEADDLFARYAHHDSRYVIMTHDKDMRMIPGLHLTWKTHELVDATSGFSVLHDDKEYGHKWFWLQMLMGDPVDNIPGLPKYNGKNIGEKGAAKALADTRDNLEAAAIVFAGYEAHYGEGWRTHVLEQASLLWMRRSDSALDVLEPGGAMDFIRPQDEHWLPARREIMRRVTEALKYAQAEVRGGESPSGEVVGGAGEAVRTLPAGTGEGSSSAGSRPPHGSVPWSSAPGLQFAAGESGEQCEQVRGVGSYAVGVPARCRYVLAGAPDTPIQLHLPYLPYSRREAAQA